MSRVAWMREHWRVTLLAVLLVLSIFALFGPVGPGAADAAGDGAGSVDDDDLGDDGEPPDAEPEQVERGGLTNLQFGLQLSGGTRVRAPLVGLIAEDLDVEPGEEAQIARTVADELGIDSRDVTVRIGEFEGEGSVEVTERVDEEAFAEALRAAGFDVTADDVRRGVHAETRSTAVNVLQNKVNEAGLSGSTVTVATSSTGEHFIVVEVPNENRSAVLDLIGERGLVEVVMHYPDGDEYRNETVLRQGDFQQISIAQEGSAGTPPHVPVTLRSEVAADYANALIDAGFTDEGVSACEWDARAPRPDDPGYCLLTVVDGEVVYAAGLGPSLADSIRDGSFEDRPSFQMETTEFEEARTLSLNLRAGALPAELDLGAGTQYFLEPSLAEDFKVFSLIVGMIAALAVAGMVYWRYRDVRVAAPMLLTASAEVIILLAFAAIVPIPLDLAHIAGFIAVLGTGVDDLIIIADEILQRGEIRTGRVFESRFRKAFWIIGAAAATTIVAMTPLVYMSLGDLTGFALVTIIGVIIGVTITRPAYGDILRILILEG